MVSSQLNVTSSTSLYDCTASDSIKVCVDCMVYGLLLIAFTDKSGSDLVETMYGEVG